MQGKALVLGVAAVMTCAALSVASATLANADSGAQTLLPQTRGFGVWRGREVQFRIVDGWAVVEGDIILGRADALANAALHDAAEGPLPKGFAFDTASDLWPSGASALVEIP